MCVQSLSLLMFFFLALLYKRGERASESRLLFLFGLPLQHIWAASQVSGSHAFYPNRFSAAVWKWAAEGCSLFRIRIRSVDPAEQRESLHASGRQGGGGRRGGGWGYCSSEFS